LLAGLTGRVLEVGTGNGLNFPHYPATVTEAPAASSAPFLGSSPAARAGPRPGRAVPWAWTTSMRGRPHGRGEPREPNDPGR
jgi:hypothetical protein